ncbi:MAG: type I phosphomannose isomerase catalytic subunit [Bacteroidota bacterium]
MNLYPLKFKPILKEKIWGGSKIKDILSRGKLNEGKIGETWELSTIEENESIVSNGVLKGQTLNELIEKHPKEILGEDIVTKYRKDFPLLIKYIDANQDLSVQVHPNDKLAKERHNSKGKTESWYIMQSDKDSKIYYDLKEGVSKTDFTNAINNDNTLDLINQKNVKEGDFFHIPAGTVHTIGKGNLILEIQQASDITYRIFDFNRTDDKGNKRELHIEDALEAINYEKTNNDRADVQNPNILNNNPYYKISKIEIENSSLKFENNSQLKILISVKGKGEIKSKNDETTAINYSDIILIPAALPEFSITAEENMELLIVTLN